MAVKFNGAGTEMLLEKLETVAQGKPLTQRDINEIMTNRVIDIWITAYESWIPYARSDFEKILKSLHTTSPDGLSEWGEMIDGGVRGAAEDLKTMRRNLALLSNMNWAQAEGNALKYLPKGTPINVDVFATVDAFNAGMFRPGKVFMSILYVDPSLMNPDSFGHEFHHGGMDYWWKQNPLVIRYMEEKDTREHWVLMLFEYMVSEGLAKGLCDSSLSEETEGDSPMIALGNAITHEYEKRWDEFHEMLEKLIDDILESRLDGLNDRFEQFTIGTPEGPPIGHFFSGRMVSTMNKSSQVQLEQIINLVKEPFDFFKYYNVAAKEQGLREISPSAVRRLDELIEKMRDISA